MGIEYKCDRCGEYFTQKNSVAEFEASFSSTVTGAGLEYAALLCHSCVTKIQHSLEKWLKGD